MFKFDHYFLVNGDWENDGYSIRDRIPEKNDVFYVEGYAFVVADIKPIKDDGYMFEVYLD